MEETSGKQNSQDCYSGEIVSVAHGQETVVVIPVIVPPVEVEVPLRAIPVEVRDVAIAIDLGDRACAIGHLCHHPLNYASGATCLIVSRDCIVFVILCITNILHQRFLIFYDHLMTLSMQS